MLLRRTLWLIETRLNDALTLEALARDLGVTPAWLTRAFAMATGRPLMRHVWARRLTEAARTLARPDPPSVLTVALDAGYASPEAFARAFRLAFGLSPRDLIARGTTDGLPLTPALEYPMTDTMTLTPPTIAAMPDRRIAGTRRRFTIATRAAIPGHWADHMAAGQSQPGADPLRWYGVCASFDEDGGFDYIVGQEAVSGQALPAGWVTITLPAGNWARFRTTDHISSMGAMWDAIYRDWIGSDRLTPRDGPSVEYYPPEFDGATGRGGYEIWMPVT